MTRALTAVLMARQGTGRPKEPHSFVVTGSRDKTIKLWDAASGQLLREFVGTQTSYSLLDN